MHECTCRAFWLLCLEIVFYFSSLILNSLIALNGSQQLSTAFHCACYFWKIKDFSKMYRLWQEFNQIFFESWTIRWFCSYNLSDSVRAQCTPSYFRWEAPSWLAMRAALHLQLLPCTCSNILSRQTICSFLFSSHLEASISEWNIKQGLLF